MPKCGIYENLFLKEDPNEVEGDKTFLSNLNPNSLEVLPDCKLEPSLAKARRRETAIQFERLGYFCVDPDTTAEAPGVQPHCRLARYVGQDREPRQSQRRVRRVFLNRAVATTENATAAPSSLVPYREPWAIFLP